MRERILCLLREACALGEAADEESRFEQLSLDSLSYVAFLVQLEEEFGIEFEDEALDLREAGTVGELLRLVEEKVK